MLTEKQQLAQRFIERSIRDTGGTAPSFRQITAAIGCKSPTSGHRVVHALAARGFIRFHAGLPRSIEVLRHIDGDSRDAVICAARRLIDRLISDSPENGSVVVRSDDLGDLDIAIAELDAAI